MRKRERTRGPTEESVRTTRRSNADCASRGTDKNLKAGGRGGIALARPCTRHFVARCAVKNCSRQFCRTRVGSHPPHRNIKARTNRALMFLAEGVGFEPTILLRGCRFSRPVRSTAPPPFRVHHAPVSQTVIPPVLFRTSCPPPCGPTRSARRSKSLQAISSRPVRSTAPPPFLDPHPVKPRMRMSHNRVGRTPIRGIGCGRRIVTGFAGRLKQPAHRVRGNSPLVFGPACPRTWAGAFGPRRETFTGEVS